MNVRGSEAENLCDPTSRIRTGNILEYGWQGRGSHMPEVLIRYPHEWVALIAVSWWRRHICGLDAKSSEGRRFLCHDVKSSDFIHIENAGIVTGTFGTDREDGLCVTCIVLLSVNSFTGMPAWAGIHKDVTFRLCSASTTKFNTSLSIGCWSCLKLSHGASRAGRGSEHIIDGWSTTGTH